MHPKKACLSCGCEPSLETPASLLGTSSHGSPRCETTNYLTCSLFQRWQELVSVSDIYTPFVVLSALLWGIETAYVNFRVMQVLGCRLWDSSCSASSALSNWVESEEKYESIVQALYACESELLILQIKCGRSSVLGYLGLVSLTALCPENNEQLKPENFGFWAFWLRALGFCLVTLDFWLWTFGVWDLNFDFWTLDQAVVINLGTNDYLAAPSGKCEPLGQAFGIQYLDFIEKVRHMQI